MTTITYRNGVMAADSRAYSGDKMPIGAKTKIFALSDGTLIGVSTTSVGGDGLVRAWVEAGCKPQENTDLKPESFDALMVRPNGDVFFACNNLAWTGPLTAEYFAIGSGAAYALGAMECGRGPEAAVDVACALDVWSDGPVIALSLRSA